MCRLSGRLDSSCRGDSYPARLCLQTLCQSHEADLSYQRRKTRRSFHFTNCGGSFVTNGGRSMSLTHESSRPFAEPFFTNSAYRLSTHSNRKKCPVFEIVICLPFGRERNAPAAACGGATGSRSPLIIRTGTLDLTGSLKAGATLPFGHCSQAFIDVRIR